MSALHQAFTTIVHGQVPEVAAASAARAWEQICRDPRSKRCNPLLLAESLHDAVMNGSALGNVHIEKILADNVAAIVATPKACTASIGKVEPVVPQAPHAKKNPGFTPKKDLGPYSERLATSQKIYGGMSLVLAALSALGAVRAFGNSVATDETGQRKMDFSQVGMGLLSAALAAGCAYSAHQQLTGRAF